MQKFLYKRGKLTLLFKRLRAT